MLADSMIEVKECPVCGAIGSRLYYGLGAPNRIPVTNRVCDRCGTVFQSPRPAPHAIREYYARYMQSLQPDVAGLPVWYEETLRGIARLRLLFLKRHLRPGDRILDVGCSYGILLDTIRRESGMSTKVVGVNPEASVAELARTRFGLTISTAMIEDADFSDGSFDLIILDNVIEHIQSLRDIMSRLYRLLSDGGRIYIVTNNAADPHGFLWQNFFPDHTVTFSEKTLSAFMKSCGFDLTDADTQGHTTLYNYHYPYIQSLFHKVAIPAELDWEAWGDNPAVRKRHAQRYQRKFYRQDGLGKCIYELSLRSNKGVAARALIAALSTARRLSGRRGPFILPSHTLPPYDYSWQCVAIGVCRTQADLALAHRLINATSLAPQLYLFLFDDETLRSIDVPDGTIRITKTEELIPAIRARHKRIDELLAFQLDDVWMDADVLARAHERAVSANENACRERFTGDGKADWMLARGPAVTALLAGSWSSIFSNTTPIS